MSKKKSTQHKVQQRHQPAAVPARKSNSRTLWIVAAVVVLVLGVIWAASGNKGGGAQKANAAPLTKSRLRWPMRLATWAHRR